MADNRPSPSPRPRPQQPGPPQNPDYPAQGHYGVPPGMPTQGYPQGPPPTYGPPAGYGAPPPGYGPPSGYPGPGGQPPKKRAGFATAALVLGIIGFIMAVIPFVNFAAYPIVVLAIVFGLLAIRWGKGKAGLILGVLGLVATILWTVGIAGAFDDAVNKKHTVEYQVSGTGQIAKADITYYTSDGSNKSSNISADNQTLPFTKTVTVKGDLSGFVLTANIPITASDGPAGTLSCRLLVDGKQVATDSSSGTVQDVSCFGTGYDGK